MRKINAEKNRLQKATKIMCLVIIFLLAFTVLILYRPSNNAKNIQSFYKEISTSTNFFWDTISWNQKRVIKGWSGKIIKNGTWDFIVKNIDKNDLIILENILQNKREMVGYCDESSLVENEKICSYEDKYIGCEIFHDKISKDSNLMNVTFACYNL